MFINSSELYLKMNILGNNISEIYKLIKVIINLIDISNCNYE